MLDTPQFGENSKNLSSTLNSLGIGLRQNFFSLSPVYLNSWQETWCPNAPIEIVSTRPSCPVHIGMQYDRHPRCESGPILGSPGSSRSLSGGVDGSQILPLHVDQVGINSSWMFGTRMGPVQVWGQRILGLFWRTPIFLPPSLQFYLWCV